MFSLQSDFSRHFLLNLLGPAELRMFIHLFPLCLLHLQHNFLNYSVLRQSSGPTPSDSLKERLGKAKSSDVAQSSLNALCLNPRFETEHSIQLPRSLTSSLCSVIS